MNVTYVCILAVVIGGTLTMHVVLLYDIMSRVLFKTVKQGIFEGYKFSWFSWLKSNPRKLIASIIILVYTACTYGEIHENFIP